MLLSVLATCLLVQGGGETRETAKELRELEGRLANSRLAPAKREAALRGFLSKHAKSPDLAAAVRHKLRTKLAVLELANRKPEAARRSFRRVQRETSDRDLLARCGLGIAQSFELLGNEREAIRRYDEVFRRFAGTHYARAAKRARDRLRVRRKRVLGRVIELPADLTTVDGRRPPRPAAGGRALLVCLAPGTKELPEPLRPFERGERGAEVDLLVFVRGKAASELAKSLGRRAWVFDRSLHEKLGIGVLPTWLLVDSRWRVLDRNPGWSALRK